MRSTRTSGLLPSFSSLSRIEAHWFLQLATFDLITSKSFIVMAPLTTFHAIENHVLSDLASTYYTQRHVLQAIFSSAEPLLCPETEAAILKFNICRMGSKLGLKGE